MTAPASTGLRAQGVACAAGGVVGTVLAVDAVIDPAVGPWWLLAVFPATALLVVGVHGVWRAVRGTAGVARPALAVAVAMFAVFALTHVWAYFAEDAAIPFLSAASEIGSLALLVAGAAMLRGARSPLARVALVTGVWGLVAIPVGGILGDRARFVAIAVLCLTWIALGSALATTRVAAPASPPASARVS